MIHGEEITRKIRVILARFTYRAFLALNFLSLVLRVSLSCPAQRGRGPFLMGSIFCQKTDPGTSLAVH